MSLKKAVRLQVSAVSSPSLSLSPLTKVKQKKVKSLVSVFILSGQNFEPHPVPIDVQPSPHPPHQPPPHQLSSRFGTSAGRGRLAAWAASVICPFVQAATAGVHEEVADCAELKAQLLRDGELHLLGRPFVLLKDGQQGAPLQVSEDQPGLLWCAVALLGRVLLLPFAGCQGTAGGEKRQKERVSHS